MEKLSFQIKHWTVYVGPGYTVAVGWDEWVSVTCFFLVQKQWLPNASILHYNQ